MNIVFAVILLEELTGYVKYYDYYKIL